MINDQEIIDVRNDEKLDQNVLIPIFSKVFNQKIDHISIKQFSGGHANLTYLVSFNDSEFVLRRPPLGPLAPSSHDMEREHRVQKALNKILPIVPNSIYYCHDYSILGSHFHIIERRYGYVIRSHFPKFLKISKDFCYVLSCCMVEMLSELHKIDPEKIGLQNLGRPKGFVERQVYGWEKRWKAATENQLLNGAFDDLIFKLKKNIPISNQVSIIHNDFKLDNIMWSNKVHTRPEAIFDWDMCTLGDPLMDLGHMLNYWIDRDDIEDAKLITSMPKENLMFPLKKEIIKLYSKCTGFDLKNINWYYAFGAFKLCVILQQIYSRFLNGQTKDRRFLNFDKRINALIRRSYKIKIN